MFIECGMSISISHRASLIDVLTTIDINDYNVLIRSEVIMSKNDNGTHTPIILGYRLGKLSHKRLKRVKWNTKRVILDLYKTGKLYQEYIENHIIEELAQVFTDIVP